MFYAFGYNQYNTDKNFSTIHAECHAINKLPYTSKRTRVNVLVFRICNKGNNIMIGMPCESCKKKIKDGINNKGYILNRIYYTDGNDNILFLKKSQL